MRSVEKIAHSVKGASADLDRASDLLASPREGFDRMREALQTDLDGSTNGDAPG
ncbi:MAG: hypothetical protein ACR2HO_01510 [Rubrobacteraceae bacterium]